MTQAEIHASTDVADAHTASPTLSGRKVMITGGTTGIGRAIAVLLASEGAHLYVCGRTPEHLSDALQRMRQVAGGTCDGMVIDLAEACASERFFAAGCDALGGIDIAVINAAIPAKSLTEMSEEAVRYAIATDFSAYLLSAHAAAERLKDHGDILLVGSMSAHVLGGGSTVYAGIKAGIAGFAEALRREIGPKGIKVGLIEPGKTGADFQYPDIPAEQQRAMIARETMLRAEDIAVAAHYMLTQPRRAVVQQLTIVPRAQEGE